MEQLVLRCADTPVCEKLRFTVLLASVLNHIAFPAYGLTVMGVYLLFLQARVISLSTRLEGIQASRWFPLGSGGQRENFPHINRTFVVCISADYFLG